MRRILLTILAIIMMFSMSACEYQNNVNAFYDKVVEAEAVLDIIATDVCAAWKDAAYDHNLSAKEINEAIENAKIENSANIEKLNDYDAEIEELFSAAKISFSKSEVKHVMTAYIEYRDSVLNANDSLDSNGYRGVSFKKNTLDNALRDLYVDL